MDTLVHGLIGAAIFSRTGLSGGRTGPVDSGGRRRRADWTLPVAFLFGIFPDLASLGIHFAVDLAAGNGIRWHAIPPFVFTLYRFTHSLLGITISLILIAAWRPACFLPALAWPLHVFLDVFTHSAGVFLTPILWPFSNWSFHGWSWWLDPRIFYGSWLIAMALWLTVALIRLPRRTS